VLEVENAIAIQVNIVVQRGRVPAIERDALERHNVDDSRVRGLNPKKHAAENDGMPHRSKPDKRTQGTLERFDHGTLKGFGETLRTRKNLEGLAGSGLESAVVLSVMVLYQFGL